MTARAALRSLLADDGELAGLGVQTVYATNAVDTPDEDCFLIIRWDDTTRAFGVTASSRATVWAHDKDRDYGRIAAVLQRVEDLLAGTVHRAGEDGWTLTQADWLGQGPDLYDTGYETCTRFSDFQIVSRQTS